MSLIMAILSPLMKAVEMTTEGGKVYRIAKPSADTMTKIGIGAASAAGTALVIKRKAVGRAVSNGASAVANGVSSTWNYITGQTKAKARTAKRKRSRSKSKSTTVTVSKPTTKRKASVKVATKKTK